MGKKARKKAEARETQSETDLFAPWISMRSGLIVMAIVSIGLAAWTAYQSYPQSSLVDSILWGVVFGGSLWLVFFGFMLINRFLRKRR